MENNDKAFENLIDILAKLRGPNGCPWDKEQTYQDINPYLLEEAHEVVESIVKKDFDELKEELGDLLVHIFFLSQLASEEKKFSARDVASQAAQKLIRRHPHVFGDQKASDTQEVLVNWEKIKQEENKNKGKEKKSLFDGLPASLPALITAFRLGEKSSRVGFDWADIGGVLEKIDEEKKEVLEAFEAGEKENIEKEYGDLLFTVANLGRFLKIDPETALRRAILSFQKRFRWIEEKISATDKKLQDLSTQEWDEFWREAKNQS